MMVQRRPDLHLYQGPTLACNVGPTMSVLSGQHWANVCMLTGSPANYLFLPRNKRERCYDLLLEQGAWVSSPGLVTKISEIGCLLQGSKLRYN